MIYLDLAPFTPMANGQKATTQVPRWAMTLGRIVLAFPQTPANGISKTTITEVVVKIGARVVFGPISGTELDKLNSHKGMATDSSHLVIDLTERDGLSVFAKEVGGIDLVAIGAQDVFIEVTNNYAGANPLSLYAVAGYTALQLDPDPKKRSREQQLIKKVLGYNLPGSVGNSIVWMPDFKGALIQRLHFQYTGTDWSASANGNLQRVEAKKNGTTIWSRVACLDNRFLLNEQRKTPQSRWYSLDFVHDNVHSAALDTRDARALEFTLTLGATDTVKCFVEALDLPDNL